MNTFLNIDLNENIEKAFIKKHILFSTVWLLVISVLVFNVDSIIIKRGLNPDLYWISNISPYISLLVFILVVVNQKWYYGIATVLYPALLMFWFIPKATLIHGKIYLFSQYIRFIYHKLKNLKYTIIEVGVVGIIVILMFTTNIDVVKIASIVVFFYLYVMFLVGYIKTSIEPTKIFGSRIEDALEGYIEQGEKVNREIISVFAPNEDNLKELSEEEKIRKRIRRVLLLNALIEYVNEFLHKNRSKKGFFLAWTVNVFILVIISWLTFVYINYQLLIVEPDLFTFKETPSIVDIMLYTVPSNLTTIMPNNVITKIIALITNFVLPTLLLSIIIPVIRSIVRNKIDENVQMVSKVFIDQSNHLNRYVETEFNMKMHEAKEELINMKQALRKLYVILNKLF